MTESASLRSVDGAGNQPIVAHAEYDRIDALKVSQF
jgi:hypothetical protein